jgi:hypothetical protein
VIAEPLQVRLVEIMSDANRKQQEIDANFAYFTSELPRLLVDRRGKYALLRHRKITGFYDTPLDAQTAGLQLYPDGLFSIQKVTDEIIDLGLFSHAVHLGSA